MSPAADHIGVPPRGTSETKREADQLDPDKSNAVGNNGRVCVKREREKSRLEAHGKEEEEEERKTQGERERASSPWRPWYALIGVSRKGVAFQPR